VFCPSCRDEFRSGFTRCDNCGVDLVHELPPERAATAPPLPVAVPVVDYCGYLALDDAREARDRLRKRRIASDIVIREAPGASPDGPGSEEYWLRVDRARLREAHDLLGDSDGFGEDRAAEPDAEDDSFTCSVCGGSVAAEADACPGCGSRFDES